MGESVVYKQTKPVPRWAPIRVGRQMILNKHEMGAIRDRHVVKKREQCEEAGG